uniref:Putative secreted protein n=1 Tax=Ixodes ricinus TaxID=34613 RepID=A0A6B0UPH9_IXORI
MSLRVTGGLGRWLPLLCSSCRVGPTAAASSNFLAMSEKALRMASVDPVTVTMRSGHEPSEMLILAPLSSLNFFMLSPFFPMILPTSFPCIIKRTVRVTEGPSSALVSTAAMVAEVVEVVVAAAV